MLLITSVIGWTWYIQGLHCKPVKTRTMAICISIWSYKVIFFQFAYMNSYFLTIPTKITGNTDFKYFWKSMLSWLFKIFCHLTSLEETPTAGHCRAVLCIFFPQLLKTRGITHGIFWAFRNFSVASETWINRIAVTGTDALCFPALNSLHHSS